MRKVILSLMLLLITFGLFAQQTTPPTPATPLTKEDYLRKSSGQKAGGILLMAAGAGLLYGAFAYDMNHLFDASASNTTGLYVAGLGCMGGSAALLIASGRNRRKAREATVVPAVKMDKALVPAAAGIRTQSYPSVGFNVRL